MSQMRPKVWTKVLGLMKIKKKMVRIEELLEGDRNVPEDERTMEELKKIANTVFKCIQFTTDCPSKNQSGKVPVLDLQLYVGED